MFEIYESRSSTLKTEVPMDTIKGVGWAIYRTKVNLQSRESFTIAYVLARPNVVAKLCIIVPVRQNNNNLINNRLCSI